MELTIKECKEQLDNGYIGWVESKLHKDGSWFAEPFKNLNELSKILTNFGLSGYKTYTIKYFKSRLNVLENPNNTPTENLQFLIDYISSLEKNVVS